MGSVKDLVVERAPTAMMMGVGFFDFSDRYSVFDWGEMPDHLRNKGAALCTMSAYFFEQLAKKGIRTHYLGVGNRDGFRTSIAYMPEPPTRMRIALARAIRPVAVTEGSGIRYDYSEIISADGNFVIPIEAIYRNSVPGGSSVFSRLQEGSLTLEEMGLTEYPHAGQILPRPFVDGSTKYEEFDRYPGWRELQHLSGQSDAEVRELKESVLTANDVISEGMRKAGFENEDGKLEFVYTPARKLMVADTLGTLDECRITYHGVDVSKQIPRDWYSHSQPDWKNEIDAAKRANRKNWKALVKTQPEPLPPALKDIIEAFYTSVANSVVGRTLFSGAPPVDKALGEYERFRHAEME